MKNQTSITNDYELVSTSSLSSVRLFLSLSFSNPLGRVHDERDGRHDFFQRSPSVPDDLLFE